MTGGNNTTQYSTMETMKITMRIDQAASLRRGIAAPHSTEAVHVAPDQLPGAGDLSYEEATRMHKAIVMNESADAIQRLISNARKYKKVDAFKEDYVDLHDVTIIGGDPNNRNIRKGDRVQLGTYVKDDDGKTVYGPGGKAEVKPLKTVIADKDYGSSDWRFIMDNTQELQDEAERAWNANRHQKKKPGLPEGAKTVQAYHASPEKFDKFEYQETTTSGQYGADSGFFFFLDKRYAEGYARALKDTFNKAYLYTCTVNIGHQLELEGEKVGTSFGRQSELAHADGQYDTVLIRDADTGYGITDELIVFDDDNIRIDEIHTV